MVLARLEEFGATETVGGWIVTQVTSQAEPDLLELF
jgi:hypothetical protein